MQRTLVFAALVAVILCTAVALRLSDQPYIDYATNDRGKAMDGLKQKAESGDGFAAFLVGQIYGRGLLGASNIDMATSWYMRAAELGEARAIAPYINATMQAGPNAAQCETAIRLLESAARARELNAVTSLGRAYEQGRCAQMDLLKAAGYFTAAARLDGRLGDLRDTALARLSPELLEKVEPIPPTFDIRPRDAAARFVAEATNLRRQSASGKRP